MKRKPTVLILISIIIMAAFALSACSPSALLSASGANLSQSAPNSLVQQQATPAAESSNAQAPQVTNGANPLSAYENALTAVYEKVNPSVVSIQVSTGVSGGQGSGFVWDKSGHIVTNNHVVDGAQDVQVVFYDGSTYSATVTGTDPNADLAVITVDAPAEILQPIEVGDSTQLKVGEVAIAIGNPFGLANTMTVGIVSAVGRSISSSNPVSGTAGYSNPDIIQTDAPINPGNSGGALVDENGLLIGVPTEIVSSTNSSAGIGFAVSSATVSRVVPALIENGEYSYPWLGITGSDLVPLTAEAMKLDSNQHGVLVSEVAANGPADQAGIHGSDKITDINGISIPIGGDVITAIDGQTVKGMDQLVSYLVANTQPGQKVTLSILRDGKESEIEVVLGTRPKATQESAQLPQSPEIPNFPEVPGQEQNTPSAYLGLSGVELTAAINSEMGLPEGTQGILVQRVQNGSPADTAGIQAGSRPSLIDGDLIMLGGDVLVSMNGTALTSIQVLRDLVAQQKPGDQITLDILRDGQSVNVEVTLASR